MAQSSAPIVGVNLSDTNWRDLFGDEPGVVGDLDGTAYAVTLPTNSDDVLIGSTSQPSVARVAGFSHRIPTGQPEPVTIPPASGTSRTDIIGLRYDPGHSGAPGPVRLVRIAGTSAGIPTYDASPPGVEDLPLHAITRQPGQALSQATVRQLFPRVAPSLTLTAGAPLPLSAPIGTRLRQSGIDYIRAVSTATGVPEWQRMTPESTPLLGVLMGSGWTAAGLGNTPPLGGYVDGDGFKHLSGWAINQNSMVPEAGTALFIVPPQLYPERLRLFAVPVSVGQLLLHVEVHPDGWVRLPRSYSGTIPPGQVWSFDGVTYR